MAEQYDEDNYDLDSDLMDDEFSSHKNAHKQRGYWQKPYSIN